MATSETTLLNWLQNWYKTNCNGDWEHTYGIKIETLDNPGWSVVVDLKETNLEHLTREYTLIENSDDDCMLFRLRIQSLKPRVILQSWNFCCINSKRLWRAIIEEQKGKITSGGRA